MVSGSGLPVRHVVFNGHHYMLGCLASTAAKGLLNGQHTVVVMFEKIAVSSGFVGQKMKYRFLKRVNAKSSRIPIHFTAPAKISLENC